MKKSTVLGGLWFLVSAGLLYWTFCNDFTSCKLYTEQQPEVVAHEVRKVWVNGYTYYFSSPLPKTQFWEDLDNRCMTAIELENVVSGLVAETIVLPPNDKARFCVRLLHSASGDITGVWACPIKSMTKNVEALQNARIEEVDTTY